MGIGTILTKICHFLPKIGQNMSKYAKMRQNKTKLSLNLAKISSFCSSREREQKRKGKNMYCAVSLLFLDLLKNNIDSNQVLTLT